MSKISNHQFGGDPQHYHKAEQAFIADKFAYAKSLSPKLLVGRRLSG